MTPEELLTAHVVRFNEAVHTGDWGPMVAAFTADVELVFVGVPFGPLSGRDAIVAAYSADPPDDEIAVLETSEVAGEAVAVYAWRRDSTPAGRLILTPRDGGIARLVVTFEPGVSLADPLPSGA